MSLVSACVSSFRVTWVVAFTGFPAGAVVAGDVRITLRDARGRERYLRTGVQKVHLVARHAVVAFAGSIGAGFEAVEAARMRWARIPSNHAVWPQEVAERLGWHMQRHWRRFSHEVQRSGLQLLVVGWVPEELDWFREVGGPPGQPMQMFDPSRAPARTRGFALRSPAFDVHEGEAQSPIEIGSGSEVAAWGDELRRLLESSDGLDDRETAIALGAPVIPALWLREAISMAMAIQTDDTVSEYVQVFSVGAGQILTAEPEARPAIARTYAEFLELARQQRFGVSGAIAVG